MGVMLLLLAALCLGGCGYDASVEELFALPRMAEGYTDLAQQLDGLLNQGYEYASPTGGRMWASAPTHGYRWSFRRGRCPHRPARMTHGLSVDVRRDGALPCPAHFFFLPPAGYFLSQKKVAKERFKKRGIWISPFS